MLRKFRKLVLPYSEGSFEGELRATIPDDGKGGTDAEAFDRHARSLGRFGPVEIVELASSKDGWRTLGKVELTGPGGREIDPWDLMEDAGTAPTASLGPLTDEQYEIFLRGGDPERRR